MDRLLHVTLLLMFLVLFGTLGNTQNSRQSSLSPQKRPIATSFGSDILDIDDENEDEEEEDDDDEDDDDIDAEGSGKGEELGSGYDKEGPPVDEDEEDEDDDEDVKEEDDVVGNDDDEDEGVGFEEEEKEIEEPEEEEEEEEEEESDEDDDDEDDDDTVEGSAEMPEVENKAPPPVITSKLTPCWREQQHRGDGTGRQGARVYRPQCSPTGEFMPMQCVTSTRECWCVDSNGDEIVGTMQKEPFRPNCSGKHTGSVERVHEATTVQQLAGGKPRTTAIATTTTTRFTDDFELEGELGKRATTTSPKDRHHPKTTTASPYSDLETEDDNGHRTRPAKDRGFFESIRDPLILAGIIGGAVLALLCIVLLVMFTIYRMRKKDEGSYALEEPRRTYDIRYTRANNQEYFA